MLIYLFGVYHFWSFERQHDWHIAGIRGMWVEFTGRSRRPGFHSCNFQIPLEEAIPVWKQRKMGYFKGTTIRRDRALRSSSPRWRLGERGVNQEERLEGNVRTDWERAGGGCLGRVSGEMWAWARICRVTEEQKERWRTVWRFRPGDLELLWDRLPGRVADEAWEGMWLDGDEGGLTDGLDPRRRGWPLIWAGWGGHGSTKTLSSHLWTELKTDAKATWEVDQKRFYLFIYFIF